MNPRKSFALTLLMLSALPSLGSAAGTQVKLAPDSTSRYEVYVVSGPIGTNTVQELEAALAMNKSGRGRVVFDSDGGDLLAGLELGALIRKEGLDTEIAQYASDGKTGSASCHSACVLALLGGRYRFASANSLIGLHRFHRRNEQAGDLALAQVVSNALGAHIMAMGASYGLFSRMVEVAGNQLSFLPYRDALALGLINQGRIDTFWDIGYSSNGSATLNASRMAFQAEGVLTLGCTPHHRPTLSIHFKDVRPDAIKALRAAQGFELVTGGRMVTLYEKVGGPRILQGTIAHDFLLPPESLWELRQAHSIAVKHNGEVIFDVEKGTSASLANAFMLLCEGAAHRG